MQSLTVIEDNDIFQQELVTFLNEKFQLPVYAYSSAEEFLANPMPATSAYLLDWNLPGRTGLEVAQEIRSTDKLATIVLMTAYFDHEKYSEALRNGADDILEKPFSPEDLVLRLQCLDLRKKEILHHALNVGVRLVPEACTVIKDGKPLTLTSREYQVFSSLYANVNQVMPRASIFQESSDSGRNLDFILHSLRKKIEGFNFEIEVVRGKGYLLREAAPFTRSDFFTAEPAR